MSNTSTAHALAGAASSRVTNDNVRLPHLVVQDERASGDESSEFTSAVLPAGSSASSEPALVRHNDATFHSGKPADEVLHKPLALGWGKRSTEKVFKKTSMPLGTFLHVMTAHKVGEKDGRCFMQGAAIDDVRRKTAMISMEVAGLDVDSGMPYETVLAKLKAAGYLALLYTTHSHGKGVTTIAETQFRNWCRKNGYAENLDDLKFVKAYLTTEKSYEPEVVASVTGIRKGQESTGMMLYVDHRPMDKCRIILPLDGAGYVFSEIPGVDHNGAMKGWGLKLRGLATELGLPIDESCLDPSRLFYMPRHAEGAPFRVDVVNGGLVDIHEVADSSTVNVGSDVFARAAVEMGARMDGRPDNSAYKSPKADPDIDLWAFSRERGEGFEIADLFRARAPQFIIGDENADKLTVMCPFNGGHSNPGDPEDPACMVQNASDAGDSFKFLCRHESCREYRKTDLLCEAINLGYFEPGAILDDEFLSIKHQVKRDIEGATLPPEKWPDDFIEEEGCIYHLSSGPRGKGLTPVFVCDAFTVVGQAHDEHDGDWSLVIEFKNPKGVTQRHRIPRGMIQADARGIRRDLAATGLSIDASAEAQKRFDTLLSRLKPGRFILSVTQAGWHDKDGPVFVTPQGVGIGPAGERDDVEMAAEHCMIDVKSRGTFEDWQAGVGTACRRNKHWAIGTCTAFVGPLLGLVGRPSCGIAFSGDSSLGKSTAQTCAASVWGHPAPSKGLLHQMSTTPNALENLAARSNHTTLQLDELAQASPETVGTMIFNLTGGTGKSRQRADGSLRASKTWVTCFLFTSERGLADIIQDGHKTLLTGHSVRVADIDISNGVEAVDPDTMKLISAGCHENFGHAGPLFIRHLFDAGYVARPEEVRRRLRLYTDALCEEGASPPVRRAAEIFGALRCGGEIAKEAGLLPADVDLERAISWAWGAFRGGTEAQALNAMERAINTLAENIRTKMGNEVLEFGVSGSFRGAKAYYDEIVIYVLESHLAELAGKANKPQAIAKELDKRGILIRPAPNRLAFESAPRIGKVKHYQLRREALIGKVE